MVGHLHRYCKKNLKFTASTVARVSLLKTEPIFYGAIYAPNADVRSHNSVEMYGEIVANSFIQDVSANLHYDASLRDVNINDEGVRFVVKHWCEGQVNQFEYMRPAIRQPVKKNHHEAYDYGL